MEEVQADEQPTLVKNHHLLAQLSRKNRKLKEKQWQANTSLLEEVLEEKKYQQQQPNPAQLKVCPESPVVALAKGKAEVKLFFYNPFYLVSFLF